MGTLIVAGGAGFIGSTFVRRVLATTEHRVVVFDKLTYAGHLANLSGLDATQRYTFVRGDVADKDAVGRVITEHRPTGILNFAAESHVDRSIDDAADFVRTNITGTYELLEGTRSWLAGAPPDVRASFRFIHISTDEVYGSLTTGAATEESPYSPASPYAASKAAADHLARAWARTYGLPVIVTNCTNNYGPYQFPEKVIPLMLLNAIEGKPLPLYGDGLHQRDWLHVEDHCDALLRVLAHAAPGTTWNVSAGTECTNRRLIELLCAELERQRPGGRYERLIQHVADRPGHDRRYALDSSKIRKELGWKPQRDLTAGLAETVRWYLGHHDWCETVQKGRYQRERLGLPQGS